MIKELCALRAQIKRERPLIHCITNPISINACANAILAAGARPIMAEHPREAAQITASAAAFVGNLGNITDIRIESIGLSMKEAAERGIPSVLDLVGTACSSLRLQFAAELIEKTSPSILKGNITELRAVAGALRNSREQADRLEDEAAMAVRPKITAGAPAILPEAADIQGIGVDARQQDSLSDENLYDIIREFSELSERTGSVILASGKQDLIVRKQEACLALNGVEMLSCITGTGCMLGALCGVYLTGGDPFLAALTAVSVLNIAGEAADTPLGPGSFQVRLFDSLYSVRDTFLAGKLNIKKVE